METIFLCSTCGKKTSVNSSDPVPSCCGGEMTPQALPVCTIPVSAESARTAGEDGPCFDGTTPKKP
ncbi:MAG: hypothetical protein NTW38_03385 [Candidatus Aminicenantes bacterium]|nr:hypothetical protein [Candidatus Aminicenantes bacterium]